MPISSRRATLAEALSRRDQIELSAPLAIYLPDYPNRAVATKVTIHQLLTHTAGTPDILNGDILVDVLAHRHELRTLADYVTRYAPTT